MNGKKVIPAQQHDWLSLLAGVVDVLQSPADGIISYIYIKDLLSAFSLM